MFVELPPDQWLCAVERKLAGVNALPLLVEGPKDGTPDPVKDAEAWVHRAFGSYQ
jgi:hypothetical protein